MQTSNLCIGEHQELNGSKQEEISPIVNTDFSTKQALVGVIMTQYHVQKGLKMFGEASADRVRKELQQLHDHKIPKLVHPEGLSKEQFTKVLEYLMFLREKQSGVIKGWGCTNGRPQCLYTGKAQSASLTILMESVVLTAVVEAQEHRAVYTVNIPGAFMQGDQDEVIHMVLCGTLATMLVECDPKLYEPYCCQVTEVDNLHGIYPLKDEWVFGCSLKTRLPHQTKTQQLKWLW